ncbi:tRNA dihydrouridine synthase DusB [Candidatus Woesearchaeota archaeon]|nr:tRNA dihydrouridine synthase DusB [Candidatus Woesearchaeota archaeon]
MQNIGNVRIPNQLVLAPMADVCWLPFRLLCRRYGAGLVFNQMVNANALARSNKATLKMILTDPQEKPVAMQMFAAKIDNIKASALILEKKCDILDFNLGCPASSVVNIGAGSALLKRPAKIKEIIETLVDTVKIPVTAKIRSGISDNQAVKTARIIESAGASAITIHARTQQQGYSGKAKWSVIKEVKDSISIPVIGNGDVFSPEDAKAMLDQTNCDFIMIGRAAMKDPSIFRRTDHYLSTGELLPEPEKTQKLEMLLELYSIMKKYDFGIKAYREYAMWFTKGLDGSNKLRDRLSRIEERDALIDVLKDF